MFSVSERDGAGGMKTLVLQGPGVSAEVVPERGALLTSLRFGDDEVLFLDEATLVDRSKNVRGGVPVLFPIAGKLPGDAYQDGHRDHHLKQHGFARQRPFRVVSQEAREHVCKVTLELTDSDATFESYPWKFALRLTFALHATALELHSDVENRDARHLPYHLGYHPYFRIPASQKAAVKVMTDATRLHDNRAGHDRPYDDPEFTKGELDWHLHDHFMPGTQVLRPPAHPLRLGWTDAFDTLVLWTLPDKDFVCVEPWTAKAGALATGHGIRTVLPGHVDRQTFTIGL